MTRRGNQTQAGNKISRKDELTIASDFGELEHLRRFIRRFCRRSSTEPPASNRICDIELVATEVVTNIIRHAYRGAGDQNIHINLRMENETLILTVQDWGRPFDPEQVPPPDFDGSRSGGFGLYIIDQLVDELVFSRNESGCNHTRLTINMKEGRGKVLE